MGVFTEESHVPDQDLATRWALLKENHVKIDVPENGTRYSWTPFQPHMYDIFRLISIAILLFLFFGWSTRFQIELNNAKPFISV